MTSRHSINFRDICLPHISTRKMLTRNPQNGTYSKIQISEYDVSEAFLLLWEGEKYYTPQVLYSTLSNHLYEIIRRNKADYKVIYSFAIFQNQNQDNHEHIAEDISVFANHDSDDTVDILDEVNEGVNILIGNMPTTTFPIGNITDYSLLFCKHETIPADE